MLGIGFQNSFHHISVHVTNFSWMMNSNFFKWTIVYIIENFVPSALNSNAGDKPAVEKASFAI